MHPNMDEGFLQPPLSNLLSLAAASNEEPAADKNAIHTAVFQVDPFPRKNKQIWMLVKLKHGTIHPATLVKH